MDKQYGKIDHYKIIAGNNIPIPPNRWLIHAMIGKELWYRDLTGPGSCGGIQHTEIVVFIDNYGDTYECKRNQKDLPGVPSYSWKLTKSTATGKVALPSSIIDFCKSLKYSYQELNLDFILARELLLVHTRDTLNETVASLKRECDTLNETVASLKRERDTLNERVNIMDKQLLSFL